MFVAAAAAVSFTEKDTSREKEDLNMIKCQFCGTELEDNALFCHECGAKVGTYPADEVEEQVRTCSSCGAELNPGVKFCSQCGASVSGDPAPETSASPSGIDTQQIRNSAKQMTENITAKVKANPKLYGIIAAVVVVIIVLIIVISSLTGSDSPSTSGSGSGTSSPSYSTSGTAGYDDDTYELLAVSALLKEIDRKYSAADPGSCKYNINKTQKEGNYTVVYGKLYLYDQYGKATTGYSDGSGSYIRTFEVKINDNTGSVSSCTIK